MTQVQVRLPEGLVEILDQWIAEGKFKSRSDAIRSLIQLWAEREKTREFRKMLDQRSQEVKTHPDQLTRLEDLE